jgi:predicted amidophosphoribosyltransferase
VSGGNQVKYYCEFCGSLVRLGDRICPHCGSFFSQVRCPVCSFEGESHLFRQGCPSCGFASKDQPEAKPTARPAAKAKAAAPRPGLEPAYTVRPPAPKRQGGMPAWVLAVLVLLFVVIAAFAAVLAKG